MSFFGLRLADGPPCPHCGCRDAEITQRPDDGVETWWMQGRAICNHCKAQFAFRELPEKNDTREADPLGVIPMLPVDVTYPVRGCPECGSPNTRVASSPKSKPGKAKLRYHDCMDCPAKFKSLDSRKV